MYIILFGPLLGLLISTVSSDNSYFLAPTRYDTWWDAQAYCESVNAQLATWDTMADWNAIDAQCGSTYCWVGFNDDNDDNTFEFVDGEPFVDLGVWGVGEPHHEQKAGRHCGNIRNGLMHDGTCGGGMHNLAAVCEDECSNPCTPENMQAGNNYHESCSSCCHFIQCDPWGTAYELACPEGTYWDQNLLACDHISNGECTECNVQAAMHINQKQIGDVSKNIENSYNYYKYIGLIGVIAFILINNIFIGCWCLGKYKNKGYAKCDMV
eukprot:97545_1